MDKIFSIGLMVVMLASIASAASIIETNVNDVIIYPQSTSLIKESGTESQGSEFSAGINRGAYADSIRVSGALEMSVSSEPMVYPRTLIESPIRQLLIQVLNKTVKIGDMEGTLSWIGESWIGLAGEKFIAVPINSVISIESVEPLEKPEVGESPEARTNVSWRSGGGRNVEISYLSGGLSWSPVYFLDAGETSSRFEFWARVNNNFEPLEARVRLLGGDINIRGGSASNTRYMTDTQMDMAYASEAIGDYYDSAPTVSTSGEYEIYDLGRKSLEMGESRLISIFAGPVTPEKHYVWNTRSGDKVERIYEVENSGKTWVRGTVKVYEHGMLVGEDSIDWTPKGRNAKITIGKAPDIEVSKRTSTVSIGYKRSSTSTLRLKNYKAEEVTVQLTDYLPSNIDAGTFKPSHDFEQLPGNMIVLNLTLGAGASEEIVYSYTT